MGQHRPQGLCCRLQVPKLGAKQHHVAEARIGRVAQQIRLLDMQIAQRRKDPQTFRSHGVPVGAARGKDHIIAVGRQPGAEVTANPTGPVDQNLHAASSAQVRASQARLIRVQASCSASVAVA